MGKLKYLVLILLFLLGAAILLGMRFPQGASGSIEGFVRDENGAPIARVSIQAFQHYAWGDKRGLCPAQWILSNR
jgi:hypothetical protein